MLHSIYQQIWKTLQWPQDWKRSVFSPIPKKGNAKECSNYYIIALISHASKVMLKIPQARLQQYVNWELPDVQAGFRKGRGTRDQMANICWIIEKAKEFQKNIYFSFTEYTKAFDFVDHNKLENSFVFFWKILKRDGNIKPPYLSLCRSRSNSWNGTWFKIGKGVRQGCILSFCLFNYMQSTSCEMPGWMKHKLESRLPGEVSITSDMQMIHPNGRKCRGAKEPLEEGEREEWKIWLKTQHSKD